MSLISPPPITRLAVEKDGSFVSGWINFFVSLFNVFNCLGNSGTSTIVVAANGGSFSFPLNMETIFLTPASSLSTFTIVLPSKAIDGQPIYISSTQAISALTLSPVSPSTVSTTVVTLSANTGIALRYNKSKNIWYRFL